MQMNYATPHGRRDTVDQSDLERRLSQYAADPESVGITDTDALMSHCLELLAAQKTDNFGHWFCHRAPTVVIEAATFLIRLHAYANEHVERWKKDMIAVLHSCCDCGRGYENAKKKAKTTYLSTYSQDILRRFFVSVDDWEADIIDQALVRNNGTLEGLPTPIIHHVLSNLELFRREKFFALFGALGESVRLDGWPPEPPPGVILLLADERPQARSWVKRQITPGTSIIVELLPMSALGNVFTAILGRLASGDREAMQTDIIFKSILPPSLLWPEVPFILRLLSHNAIRKGLIKLPGLDFAHLVIGHLHDVEKHFGAVLRCFIILLQSLGSNLWANEAPEFPQVVVDSVKDNRSFQKLLSSSAEADNWALTWFEDYLYTVWDRVIYGDALAKIFAFLGEELQHASFDMGRRATALTVLFKLMLSCHRKSRKEKSGKNLQAARQTFEVHAAVVTDVAFAKAYNGGEWADSRTYARLLLRNILQADAEDTKESIIQVSKLRDSNLKTSKSPPEIMPLQPLSVHSQLWRKSYDTLGKDDPDGIALLIGPVAASAYFDALRAGDSGAFADGKVKAEVRQEFGLGVTAINRALNSMRGGFLTAVERFTEHATSATVRDLFRQPDVVANIMRLMLSPVDQLNEASKALPLSAYEEVGERSECFRIFLEKFPEYSFSGIISYLETFNTYTAVVPEACTAAKSLVRCLTDVLEALCGKADGLLIDETFGREGNISLSVWLPKLWRKMTDGLSIIFKRTQAWSRFYSNEEMVDWMRDALIFGRDLVAQVSLLQSVSAGTLGLSVMASPRKLSRVEALLVENLYSVLAELISWLKLTDDETLHQSFELLKSLLKHFADSGSSPPEEVIQKLEDHARRKPGTKTQLTDGKLSELLIALSPLSKTIDISTLQIAEAAGSSDDDIVYLGTSTTLPDSKAMHLNAWDQAKKSSTSIKGYKQAEGKNIESLTRAPQPIASASKAHKPSIIVQGSKRPDAKGSAQPETAKKSIADARAKTIAHQRMLGVSVPPLRQMQQESLRKATTTGRPGEPKNEGSSRLGGAAKPSSASSSDDQASEDDDESEEDGKGLASLIKQQKSPQKAPKPFERRTVQRIDIPMTRDPYQEQLKQREEARRNLLRLKPDLGPLHRQILAWNYDHDGTEPPPSSLRPRPSLVPVPDSYPDHDSHGAYMRVFEPLILMEAWSQLAKSKEDDIPSHICSIVNRQFIDDWLDCDMRFSEEVPPAWYLAETDVVLLRQLNGSKAILAKVQSYKRTLRGIQTTLRCNISSEEMKTFDLLLAIHSQWHLRKVWSLSTIHREYAALLGLPYYDLFRDVMRPRPVALPKISATRIKEAMSSYALNQPQATAILASLETDGFALIQGPPGTGKTSTILGLVSSFLSTRTRPATSVQPGQAPRRLPPAKKLLVCAPSNAAIDEVAKRIKEGVRDSTGRVVFPKVVRIGPTDSVSAAVRDISLDDLVAAKLSIDPKESTDVSGEIASIRGELEVVKRQREAKQAELRSLQDNTSRYVILEKEVTELNRKRMQLTSRLDKIKDKQQSSNRTLDANRRRFRLEVLQEADVICSTLSASGHELLDSFEFETVVIDEAAQSIELSSLIPLKYRCRRCVLVGDPQQLPPTVLSQKATEYKYNQSLFVRIQKQRPDAVHLLSIQYRMHPEISVLPSTLFYAGQLLDGPDMARKRAKPWHVNKLFAPYRFFSVKEGHEESAKSGFSLVNRSEVDVALALYSRLMMEYGKNIVDLKIGIVTMYKAQMLELKRRFQDKEGKSVLSKVDFNTVDGFQGQEKDIIILSCVRAGPNVQSVGFLSDYRRMNVALTRSRSSLFILGHAPTLERSDPVWKQIVQNARERSCFFDVNIATFRDRNAVITPAAPIRQAAPEAPIPVIPPISLLTPQQLASAQSRPRNEKPISRISRDTLNHIEGPVKSTDPQDSIERKRKNADEGPRRTPPALRVQPDAEERPSNAIDVGKIPPTPVASVSSAAGSRAATSAVPRRPPKEVNPFIPKVKKRPRPDDSNGAPDVKRRIASEIFPNSKPK